MERTTSETASLPKLPHSVHDWDSLIDDFNNGGELFSTWIAHEALPSLLRHVISSILTQEYHHKLRLLVFLEEFSETFITAESDLVALLDALSTTLHAPVGGSAFSHLVKEQFMVSVTSIFISIDGLRKFHEHFAGRLVGLMLTVINRPNHVPDRQTRATACECLRELEKCYPCLLSEAAGHLWSLCQVERTHASQCYVLLFAMIIHNIVDSKSSVSVFSSRIPLFPFSVPRWVSSSNGDAKEKAVTGLNHRESKRAMSFLLESSRLLGSCAVVEFLGMIMPVSRALGLPPSTLKVQFYEMIYSINPLQCHVVLLLYSHFRDGFDGQELTIFKRLMTISTEKQSHLVFRLLAMHWLLGLLGKLALDGEIGKHMSFVQMGLRFYPEIFDPLALKALKLDLIAFCWVCYDRFKPGNSARPKVEDDRTMAKLLVDSLLSISAFKFLPPHSTETSVVFRAIHKFLVGSSSHPDSCRSDTLKLMQSVVFGTFQEMLVDMTLACWRLVPVIVSLIDRLLGCPKHLWLGERLLQSIDECLLSKVKIDYALVAYFLMFDRIAENNTIPPRHLIELLTKYVVFLVENHGPSTGFLSWSHGDGVLSTCRTMMSHHHSSRLFFPLSCLLAFTCQFFPDLEVRDSARVYLRMLRCLPGKNLRSILNLYEQRHEMLPRINSGSFLNLQCLQDCSNTSKSTSLTSYIRLERVRPLLVQQSWSLSASPADIECIEPQYSEKAENHNIQAASNAMILQPKRINRTKEPLCIMDSKFSEIFKILNQHFSNIPDLETMPGLRVRICCKLRFESEPSNQLWGGDFDSLPAIYATVIKFSSSYPYGSIPSCHIPFLLREPFKTTNSHRLDVDEDELFGATMSLDLEPREPKPGLVDATVEASLENGQAVSGRIEPIMVGLEDMFLTAVSLCETRTQQKTTPFFYLQLFAALWEACGSSISMIRQETFLLRGGKRGAAIRGVHSVKLLRARAETMIRAVETHLGPFVVTVIGNQLVDLVKNRGVITDVVWEDAMLDCFLDDPLLSNVFHHHHHQHHHHHHHHHLLYLTCGDDQEIVGGEEKVGCFLVLIFLPPRFHLLFKMEVGCVSTLVRIRTDYWPCLAYVDEFLEALVMPYKSV